MTVKQRILLILAAALLLAALTAASGAEPCVFGNFLIVEADGRNGIANPDGEILLPAEYWIPDDQFDPDDDPVCVVVYEPTDGDFRILDPDWELENGTLKAGFFHIGSGYFSGCVWRRVWVRGSYAAIRGEDDRWALLDTETGAVILDAEYAWVCPEVTEGWVYVWLWTDEIDEEAGGPVWEIAYVRADGTVMTAPEGYRFYEWPEPIEDGLVPVIDAAGCGEGFLTVEEILGGYEDRDEDKDRD